MRIAKIDCLPFQNPMRSFKDAYACLEISRAVLVRIETDEGIIGYGEASAWQPEFYGETMESITSAIRKYIAPRLLNQNPLNIGPLLALVDSAFAKAPCVKEGLDLALFDLAGKTLGVPVATLLGGRYRETVPVSCEIGIDTPAAMALEARRLVDMGVRVLKIKGSHEIDLDIIRIKAVRESSGNGVEIRLDPNAHWSVHGTVRAMRRVEDCRLQLLEQPVASWDYAGMAHIRSSVGIPLMADEAVWSPQDVIRISRHGAADIINIKISKTGGLLAAKKIEAVAEAEGLSCIVGTELEPGFSHAAKLHLAASMRNLEYACDFSEIAMLTKRMVTPGFVLRNGCLPVPEGPGLGVDLKEEALREMRVDLP